MNEKESMLQREFKSRDVERMRNLIKKDFNAGVGGQTGYKKHQQQYVEGDVWEENNKTWTIRNGIKMTISKLDEVKSILQLPLSCPCCKKSMRKKALDKKMYSLHKKCFDCVIEYETKLRQEGKYEEYTRTLMNANIDAHLEELEQAYLEICNISNEEGVITEDGDVEKWDGGNIDTTQIKKDFREYIETIQKIKG